AGCHLVSSPSHVRASNNEQDDRARGRTLFLRAEPRPLRVADYRHAAGFFGAWRIRRNARQRRFPTPPDNRAEPSSAGGLAGGRPSCASHSGRSPARPVRFAAVEENPRAQRDLHRRRRPHGPHSRTRRSRARYHSGALSRARRTGHRQAGQRRILRDRPPRDPAAPGRQATRRHRRHDRGLRQHHGSGGQRPRLRLPRARGLRRILLSRVPRHGSENDQGSGRHLRLGVELRWSGRGAGRVGQPELSRPQDGRSGAMTDSTMASGRSERLWLPGDWNAFFGFGTNSLVNVLVLTGLLRFVLKMPDSLVFGRILPATGLMLFLSTVYYAYLAYRLARQTGRSDVCALPSGISVPHMFVVVFVVMLPIMIATKDPIQAWEAGLTWVFVQSFVLMAGGFIGPYIRKITPRAALLGSLAGISITFISMSPAAQVFTTPVIGVVCFAVILANWFGGVKYFG